MSEFGPDDGVPTFGFVPYAWRRHAVRCAACNRKVYRGIVNITEIRDGTPPKRVVCRNCERLFDEGPTEFEGADINEAN